MTYRVEAIEKNGRKRLIPSEVQYEWMQEWRLPSGGSLFVEDRWKRTPGVCMRHALILFAAALKHPAPGVVEYRIVDERGEVSQSLVRGGRMIENTVKMEPIKVNGEPVRYDLAPECSLEILWRYIEGGCDPGTGYRLILSHDSLADKYVDAETLAMLPAIRGWLHWYAPSECHGSLDRVRAWMKQRQQALGRGE